MKKLLGISILVLLISGNTYGQETQLICSFDNDCKNKSYDQCKKDHYCTYEYIPALRPPTERRLDLIP